MYVFLYLTSVLLLALWGFWANCALWFQAPFALWGRIAAMILLTIVLSCIAAYGWNNARWFFLVIPVVLGILLWWVGIKPARERMWADEVSRIAAGTVQGQMVTVYNVRNFSWRGPDTYEPHWETRVYDLEKLSTVDLVTSSWGLPGIAHILVSFGFSDGQFLTFSVEIRKEKTEEYSTLGGLFKCFEISIIAADERDILGVRTLMRKELVTLYHLQLPPEDIRTLFLSYLHRSQELALHPRFYNTLTTNCTSLVLDMAKQVLGRLPLDYRMLLTNGLPMYIAEKNGLEPGWSFEELARRGDITLRAREHGLGPGFSQAIRRDVPGWEKIHAGL